MKHLTAIYHSNTVDHLLIATGITLLLFLVLIIIRRVLPAHLNPLAERTNIYSYRLLIDMIASTRILFILVLSVLLGAQSLELTRETHSILVHITVVAILYQAGIWGTRGIKNYLTRQKKIRFAKGSSHETTNLNIIGFIAHTFLWGVILLLILDNLGVNITTLLASLGIGGIAVALALQNILGDLFASLSIALDKPFVVGDVIAIDDLIGTVKRVGLKTTRIVSLTGEELVISNADLLKSRVHNYKKLEIRRIAFNIGVTFDTSPDKLRRINDIVRDIFSDQKEVRLDRVFFTSIGESSLNYEIVYYVDNADYNFYLSVQETINLRLIERFAAEQIEFAFPSRTLYMQQQTAKSPSTAQESI